MRDHDHEHDQGLQIMIYEIMILIGARRSRWRDRRDHDRDRVDHDRSRRDLDLDFVNITACKLQCK